MVLPALLIIHPSNIIMYVLFPVGPFASRDHDTISKNTFNFSRLPIDWLTEQSHDIMV